MNNNRCDRHGSVSSKQGITPGTQQSEWDCMRNTDVRAAFAVIANNTRENHTKVFAKAMFQAITLERSRMFAAVPDMLAKLRELYDYFEIRADENQHDASKRDHYLYKMAEITEVLEKAGCL